MLDQLRINTEEVDTSKLMSKGGDKEWAPHKTAGKVCLNTYHMHCSMVKLLYLKS